MAECIGGFCRNGLEVGMVAWVAEGGGRMDGRRDLGMC